MKKLLKVILIIILVLAIALAVLYFTQKDNIAAVMDARNYSSEELTAQLEENRAETQAALASVPEAAVREPTPEEKQAYRDGTISGEELAAALVGPAPEAAENSAVAQDPAAAPQPQPETLSPEEEAFRLDLSALLAQVYVLREDYTNKLSGMVDEAKAEYAAKTEEERSKTELVKWAAGYVSRATDLERECDGQMDAIAAALTALLKENNRDTALADELLDSYAREKSLTKSWYLSELEKRGLI